jgi:UDP-glucuronate 4-epimerase
MVNVNIDAVAELLDWSRSHGVGHFILASTGSVYKSSAEPLTEESPCHPVGFYAATKLAAEHLARAYSGLFRVVVARLFGIYGPGQPRGLFRTLLDAVSARRPVRLAGERGLRLSPLYLDDCVDALARLAFGRSEAGETMVNVGGSEATDVRAIAETMGRLARRSPVFETGLGAAPAFVADSTRLYTLLGWRPQISLEDGIARMLETQAS